MTRKIIVEKQGGTKENLYLKGEIEKVMNE